MESNREPFPEQDDPDFARGQDHELPPSDELPNQYSEGQEELPRDTPEKVHEGSFAEGQEDLPHNTAEKNTFAEGQEEL